MAAAAQLVGFIFTAVWPLQLFGRVSPGVQPREGDMLGRVRRPTTPDHTGRRWRREPGGRCPGLPHPVACGCRSGHRGSSTSPYPYASLLPSRGGKACRCARCPPRPRTRTHRSYGPWICCLVHDRPLVYSTPSDVVPVLWSDVAAAFRDRDFWVFTQNLHVPGGLLFLTVGGRDWLVIGMEPVSLIPAATSF